MLAAFADGSNGAIEGGLPGRGRQPGVPLKPGGLAGAWRMPGTGRGAPA
jgi:hypothetical protein